MRQFAVNPLQLALGGFCAFTGATMLVVPHLYRTFVYASILPHIGIWGTAFLLGAVAMFSITALTVRRSFIVVAYVYTGLLLLFLSYGFFLVRGWTGTTNYLVLGIGLLLTPFLVKRPDPGSSSSRDLLSLLIGIGFALTGIMLTAVPSALDPTIYGSAADYRIPYGLAFTVVGLALAYVQLHPPASNRVRKAIHLLFAAVSFSWMAPLLPLGHWTGAALYVGLASIVALYPWIGPYFQRISTRSLRLRFALALALVAALPLLVQATFAANHEERVATKQALTLMEEVASVVAHEVRDYVTLHQSAARALAAHPGLLEMAPADQRALLEGINDAYPDVFAVALYDSAGNTIARSDDFAITDVEGTSFFRLTRETNAPVVQQHWSESIDKPVFTLTAPVRNSDGTFAGAVSFGIESSRLAQLVKRTSGEPGYRVYIVDETGQVIAHQVYDEIPPFTDFSEEPPVKALLGGMARRGAVEYGPINDVWMAGYASAPGLGWGVVAERAGRSALAGVRASREFGLLIMFLLASAALLGGAIVVTWLTTPLKRLARALNQFAAGDNHVPLPRSPVREIDQVATAFGALRNRLNARTTERDQAEEELREQREWYQVTLASIGDAVIATGSDGAIWFLNTTAEALTGWRQEEAHGKPSDTVLSLVGEQSRQPLENPINRALQESESVVGHSGAILITRDGREIPISISSAPIRTKQGNELGAVIIFRDITEHRRAEEELRQKNEIIETVNRVGQLLSAELDLHKLVQAFTDEARELTGAEFAAFFYNMLDERGEYYTLYTLSGVPQEAFARFPLPRNTKLFGPTFKGEAVIRVDDITQDPRYGHNSPYHGMPKGHLPVCSYLAVPVVSRSGEVLGGLFFGHSKPGVFTERSERLVVGLASQTAIAMDNARLFQDAQQAIRLREQFLAVASHELKTPLTTIKGYTDLLVRQASRHDGADERLIHRCQLINHEASKLNHLIDLLLDLSRIQGARLYLEMEPVDVAALAHRLVGTLEPTLTRHEIALAGADSVLLVKADPVRLEQVLRNLLNNAIKYSPDGGLIRMELEQQSSHVCIFINDQGVGIPEEDQPHLFTQFYRSEDNGSRGISGLGLGLYIVRHLVEAHGGEIQVDSEVGKGSTFIIRLPLLS